LSYYIKAFSAASCRENLSWSDTVELIAQLGEVEPHGKDVFVFVVGTQRAFFKPHTHDLGVEEVAPRTTQSRS
jgi:hypothetical protein